MLVDGTVLARFGQVELRAKSLELGCDQVRYRHPAQAETMLRSVREESHGGANLHGMSQAQNAQHVWKATQIAGWRKYRCRILHPPRYSRFRFPALELLGSVVVLSCCGACAHACILLPG